MKIGKQKLSLSNDENHGQLANIVARAELVETINEEIRLRGWTQTKAARFFGVAQPRVSDLANRRLDRFTVDTLIIWLQKLGKNVSVAAEDNIFNYREKAELSLYVLGGADNTRIMEDISRLFSGDLTKFNLTVVDVLEETQLALDRGVTAVPCLIKEFPLPKVVLVGDLSTQSVRWQLAAQNRLALAKTKEITGMPAIGIDAAVDRSVFPFDSQESDMRTFKVHDHACCIYESAEEQRRQFVAFLQTGLQNGERCIYFINETTREYVLESMQSTQFKLKPYIDRGAFIVTSAQEVYLEGGFFTEEKMLSFWTKALSEAQTAGFNSLRVAAEMTWALSGLPGCENLATYESRLNSFASQNPLSLMCQYDRKKFSPQDIKAVIHAHPLVVTNDSVLVNPSVCR